MNRLKFRIFTLRLWWVVWICNWTVSQLEWWLLQQGFMQFDEVSSRNQVVRKYGRGEEMVQVVSERV